MMGYEEQMDPEKLARFSEMEEDEAAYQRLWRAARRRPSLLETAGYLADILNSSENREVVIDELIMLLDRMVKKRGTFLMGDRDIQRAQKLLRSMLGHIPIRGNVEDLLVQIEVDAEWDRREVVIVRGDDEIIYQPWELDIPEKEWENEEIWHQLDEPLYASQKGEG